MSKWVDILKKNDKEFETELKKDEIVSENNDSEIFDEDYNIKDPDEVFDYTYISNLIDIKLEFEEYIKNKCLPFFNRQIFMENPNDMNISNFNINYNFYDYIKYNSINYIKLIDKVNKDNEEYIKELENEEHEMNDNSDIENIN
jgi:hypothetical protein